MRKLADHFTGELLSVIPGRTRSSGGDGRSASYGEIDGGLFVFSGIYWKDEKNSITLGAVLAASGAKSHPPKQDENDTLIAVQAASSLPYSIASLLSEEPSTIREAQSTPKWPHWKGALK